MHDEVETGGRAFPHDRDAEFYGRSGMSLRDYFIAHAPAEPQPWFKPAMSFDRPEDRFVSEDGKEEFKTAREAEHACGDCYVNTREAAQQEWDAEYAKQRYIQWPAAWADAMLAERAKGGAA